MQEYEIEVMHSPSGQYFTIYMEYPLGTDLDEIYEDISKDITILAREN